MDILQLKKKPNTIKGLGYYFFSEKIHIPNIISAAQINKAISLIRNGPLKQYINTPSINANGILRIKNIIIGSILDNLVSNLDIKIMGMYRTTS